MVKIIFQYEDAIVSAQYNNEEEAQKAITKACKNYPGIRIIDIRSDKNGSTIRKLH